MSVCLACLLLLGGCAWWGGIASADRQFPVEISGLDWIEIRYQPRPDDPRFASACHLSLLGSGEIEFRTGRSPRAMDPFSMATEDPRWNDVRTDRRHIGQEEMQELFQELVDAGLFSPKGRGAPPPAARAPRIRVNARIGRERILKLLDDRRLVAIVERILMNFAFTARPVPGAEVWP